MYNPRTVACKTVTVTEEVCPLPTVTYLDMPEITFVGSTATCRATLNTQDGNPPQGISGGSLMQGYNGESWVNLTGQFDWTAPVQTVTFTWEMVKTTVWASVHCIVVNSCGAGDNIFHETASYEYTEGVADITATDITVTPSTCEAPCDIAISITWENIGTAAGLFSPAYTINGERYVDINPVTLQPGESYVKQETLANVSPGNYVICPSPN